MKENKLDVVTYMANRYGTCACSECDKEFWFMIKEFIPDTTKNELSLKCAVCGFNGIVTFDSVKENIKKDGYDIEDISMFIEIQKQAEIYYEKMRPRSQMSKEDD